MREKRGLHEPYGFEEIPSNKYDVRKTKTRRKEMVREALEETNGDHDPVGVGDEGGSAGITTTQQGDV